jgi:dienelactone hydrolase
MPAKKPAPKSKSKPAPVRRVLAPMDHIWDLYSQAAPSMTFSATNEEEWKTWRRKLKAKFLELLGGMGDPKCDLAPQVTKRRKMDGYTREHVVFQARPGRTVAAWVLTPDSKGPVGQVTRPVKPGGSVGPLPTLICLQGHGAGKDEIVGISDDGTERAEYGGYQKDFALQAVRRGFFVIAPDQFGFGERRDKEDIAESKGKSSCRKPSMAGMLLGRTVPGIRVYDVSRCIDYLQTRPECDPARIGCMGISGGGEITTFAAAVEERIQAALISGYLAHWRDSIMAILHCEDNYVPGVLQYAEMPDIACLIAPRPVFFENGTQDNIFPLKSARAAFKKIKSAYDALGYAHRCEMEVFEGDHQWWGVKGFPFMERWLKG